MSFQLLLLERCLAELENGRSVVRTVIIRTWGSTPREVGADMVVDCEGRIHGTVGGGCGEAEVYELAVELLDDPSSTGAALIHVDLTENPDEGGEKVCGGRFDVLVHRLDSDEHLDRLKEAVNRLRAGEPLEWQTSWSGVESGFWKEGKVRVDVDCVIEIGESELDDPDLTTLPSGSTFSEPLGQARTLIIVGAGHIARPLCAMAALVSYRVVILDDRAEYAQSFYFPAASQVVCGAYEVELPAMLGERTSVVLVTRGHRHDQDCLRLIASHHLEYLGMIGSRRRIDAVFAELVEEGIDADDLRRVCAPVGLEIGAQTPAEIAVSILAQMIQKRRTPEATGRETLPRQRRIRSV